MAQSLNVTGWNNSIAALGPGLWVKGGTAVDVSGNNVPVAIGTGPVLAPSQGATNFTGTSPGVYTTSPLTVGNGTTMNWSFVVQYTIPPGGAATQGILDFNTGGTATPGSYEYGIYMQTNVIYTYAQTWGSENGHDTVVTQDTNAHVAIVTCNANVVTLYVDGRSVATYTLTTTTTTTAYLRWGEAFSTLGNMTGQAGDVAFFPFGLTAAQVANLSAMSAAAPPSSYGIGNFSYGGLMMGPGTPYQWSVIDGLTGQPAIKTGNVPRPQTAGVLGGYDYPGERTTTFTLEVRNSAGSTMQQNLNAARAAFAPVVSISGGVSIPSSTAFVWYLNEGDSAGNGNIRAMTARCEKFDDTVDMGWVAGAMQTGIASVAVQMSSLDPYIYDATLVTTALPNGTTEVVTNNGSQPCPAIFTLGPGTNPQIRNLSTGASIGFNTTVTAGQTIVVDMWQGTAFLVNGTTQTNIASALMPGSTYFWLAPGATSLVSVSAASTVQYRNTYI